MFSQTQHHDTMSMLGYASTAIPAYGTMKKIIEDAKKKNDNCMDLKITCCPIVDPGFNQGDSCSVCFLKSAKVKGLSQGGEIILCVGNTANNAELTIILIEEIQHHYDRCNIKDFGDDECQVKACIELRGKTRSGVCDEGGPDRNAGETREDCLKRTATSSVSQALKCKANAGGFVASAYADPNCHLKPITVDSA